uniref:NADH-ubiquinone oxidoreductase chain 2 n=1 Tax=Bacidia sorediata TaxID=1885590 RepID=A0A515MN25_9LECA|nr:NADH dehydrogenase subunit 2 [Bacidia sorediata]
MLIYSIFFLLLSNAVTLRRDKSILYSRKAIAMMIYCIVISVNFLSFPFLENSLGLYGGLFYASCITQFFHIFIFFICGIILQLTGFYPRKIWHLNYTKLHDIFLFKFTYNNTNILNKMGQQYKIIEYPLLLLFIITGGIFLISCSDIVSIFLSIELQSYGLYLLSTIYRNSELSTSAGLTYFLLGGLSSCFILLGTSLLYVNYGTTNLDGYYILNNVSNNNGEYNYQEHTNSSKSFYFNTSLIIMLVGFLFKISAAPFHFWSPDVYDAIPTLVTTFVAIVAKISILIFLLGFTYYINNTNEYYNWKYGLLLSSFLSLIFGTVLGLTQSRIKRLFAYSTISHLGFILLALSIGSFESIESFVFYLIQYTLTNLNAFIILIFIGYSLYIYVNGKDLKDKCKNLLDRDYSPIQLISQLGGYFHINPILALSLSITLFSFVGIPPLIGFFAKQMVLSAALDKGYYFLTFVAILTSVISAVYYLTVVKQIFFDKNEYIINQNLKGIIFEGHLSSELIPKHNKNIMFNYNNITISSFFSTNISVLTLVILLFIYKPINLLNTGLILSHLMLNT